MPDPEDRTPPQEPDGTAPTVRLQWLRVEGFRNVRRGIELRFDDAATIVLGRNGTGKSTLLGLIAVAVSSEVRLLEEPYDLRWALQIGEITAECHAHADFGPQLSLFGLPPGEAGPRPSRRRAQEQPLRRSFEAKLLDNSGAELLSVSFGNRTTVVSAGGKELELGDIWGTDAAPLSRIAALAVARFDGFDAPPLPAGFVQTIGTLASTVRRFDESLDTLRGFGEQPHEIGTLLPAPLIVIGRSTSAGPRDDGPDRRSGWAMPLREAGGARWSSFIGFDRVPTRDDIIVTANEAPFLAVYARAVDAAFAQIRLHFDSMDIFGDTENWRYSRLSFLVTRKNGEIVPQERLSYGQKRLLAYLYYAELNQHVIVADELVNGLHHSWIQLCLEGLGTRQAFLTSQNPVLLDYLPPQSAEQAARQYVQCRVEAVPGGEELVWENMSPSDAQRVFDACEVGIQPVSRVLESKGLW